MTPYEVLRHELEHHRAHAYSFDDAWSIAITVAITDETKHTSKFWQETFEHQRHVWRSCYDRTPAPVLFTTNVEHGVRSKHELIA